MPRWSPTFLRAVIGGLAVVQGLSQLLATWGVAGPAPAVWPPDTGALEPGTTGTLIVALLQVVMGVALLIGAFTRWAAALLAVLVLALWYPVSPSGYQHQLVLLAALAALVASGGGALSIDGRKAREGELEAARRARLRSGSLGPGSPWA